MNWQTWFAAFGADLLPVIPPDAESDTIAKPLRGKCPGYKNADGKWWGFKGHKLVDIFLTEDQAKTAHRTGACIGIQGRNFPAFDIDVASEALADELEAMIVKACGPASVRMREGSPRRLLMYAGAGMHRLRHAFRHPSMKPEEKDWAVEFLATGQYYNVEGTHPSGARYFWRGDHPTTVGPFGLTEIDEAQVAAFWSAIPPTLERHGCTAGKHSEGATRAAGADLPLDDASLHHPEGPQAVLTFLARDPNELDYDAWVTMAHAVKAGLGPDREEHYGAFEDWCLKCPTATPEQSQKTWDSITTSRVGWRFIPYPAEVDFDEAPPDDAMPNNPEADARAAAVDRMFGVYAHVPKHKRFFCTGTRRVVDNEQFCMDNTVVASYGKSGDKSAAAFYINSAKRARKLDDFTYLPGEGPIVGNKANTWVKDGLEPLDGDASIWLTHVAEMIPDEGQRNHFLDWCGYLLQHPGRKINHACVLLTHDHGTGKDSLLAPILDGVGPSNWKNASSRVLGKENTSFLEKALVYVPEIKNFAKGEFYNFAKEVVAAPPMTVSLRKMYLDAYDIPNIQKWLMTTNSADAIRLEGSDRRFWIVDCVGHEREDKPYYRRLWGFLDDEGADGKKRLTGRRIVVAWLLKRDVSKFDYTDAPMTEAKRDMIETSKAPGERWLDEQFAEGGAFHGREIMLPTEILDTADWSVAQGLNRQSGGQALKRNGFTSLSKQHRIAGSKPTNVYVRKLTPEIEKATGEWLTTWLARDKKKGAGAAA